MTKSDPLGKAFHKTAIEATIPKFMTGKDNPVAYDPSEDMWITFSQTAKKGQTKTPVADLRKLRENWLKRNPKAAAHWANQIGTKGNGTAG